MARQVVKLYLLLVIMLWMKPELLPKLLTLIYISASVLKQMRLCLEGSQALSDKNLLVLWGP